MWDKHARYIRELEQALSEANRVIGQMVENAALIAEADSKAFAAVAAERDYLAGLTVRLTDALAYFVDTPTFDATLTSCPWRCPHPLAAHGAWGCIDCTCLFHRPVAYVDRAVAT